FAALYCAGMYLRSARIVFLCILWTIECTYLVIYPPCGVMVSTFLWISWTVSTFFCIS
ncbi:hypothetical protein B0H16DRAFT_1543254, partial [Mycena metata]